MSLQSGNIAHHEKMRLICQLMYQSGLSEHHFSGGGRLFRDCCTDCDPLSLSTRWNIHWFSTTYKKSSKSYLKIVWSEFRSIHNAYNVRTENVWISSVTYEYFRHLFFWLLFFALFLLNMLLLFCVYARKRHCTKMVSFLFRMNGVQQRMVRLRCWIIYFNLCIAPQRHVSPAHVSCQRVILFFCCFFWSAVYI